MPPIQVHSPKYFCVLYNSCFSVIIEYLVVVPPQGHGAGAHNESGNTMNKEGLSHSHSPLESSLEDKLNAVTLMFRSFLVFEIL